MFLAYIDESGRHFRTDPENYVLSTLIVGENYWQEIDNLVTQIKIKHFPALPVDSRISRKRDDEPRRNIQGL